MDTESIKRRIRKLLDLSKDDAAADGEVANAMAMAARLMDEHFLTQADVEAAREADENAAQVKVEMGTGDAPMRGKNFTTWEFSLSSAIQELVGSVKAYRTTDFVENGPFKVRSEVKLIRFYGSAEDAAMAAELFVEWATVISTMAYGKFGGCFRGDGAQYAHGFARKLNERAREAAATRETMTSPACKALVLVGAGTLAQVLKQKREAAATWLEEEQGVKLGSGGRGSGRYNGGSRDAYRAGQSDGARAEGFEARRRSKLEGGRRKLT